MSRPPEFEEGSMRDWRTDIEANLAAFCEENDLSRNLFSTEYLPAPHTPTPLPRGEKGIYCFWMERRKEWLKIGKVGPNSGPRWTTQHYHIGNADSSLPKSIVSDPEMSEVSGLDRYE
jgi:hypothetical protein